MLKNNVIQKTYQITCRATSGGKTVFVVAAESEVAALLRNPGPNGWEPVEVVEVVEL